MTNTQLLATLPPHVARRYLLAALWQHYLTLHKTRRNAAKALARNHGATILKEVL